MVAEQERRASVRGAASKIRTAYREVIREAVWTFNMDSDDGDPSIMKAMAVLFAFATVHNPIIHENPLTGMDLAFGFLSLCAVMGYKGLKLFASWKNITVSDATATTRTITTDTAAVIRETANAAEKAIQDRRAAGAHLDAEPTP